MQKAETQHPLAIVERLFWDWMRGASAIFMAKAGVDASPRACAQRSSEIRDAIRIVKPDHRGLWHVFIETT